MQRDYGLGRADRVAVVKLVDSTDLKFMDLKSTNCITVVRGPVRLFSESEVRVRNSSHTMPEG